MLFKKKKKYDPYAEIDKCYKNSLKCLETILNSELFKNDPEASKKLLDSAMSNSLYGFNHNF